MRPAVGWSYLGCRLHVVASVSSSSRLALMDALFVLYAVPTVTTHSGPCHVALLGRRAHFNESKQQRRRQCLLRGFIGIRATTEKLLQDSDVPLRILDISTVFACKRQPGSSNFFHVVTIVSSLTTHPIALTPCFDKENPRSMISL